MKAALVALWMVSGLMAAGSAPPGSKRATPMPACAELEKALAAELVGYLEMDGKGLSNSCVEFAIRQLSDVYEQLSVADTERAIGALMPFLDFPSTMTGALKWYPAKITIAGATNSVVQRLEDAHQDSDAARLSVLDRLVGFIADTAVSGAFADSAAWAVDEIMAYPHAPTGALPAVVALASAAKASANPSSSARLREEARKLAAMCADWAFQSQCDAALN